MIAKSKIPQKNRTTKYLRYSMIYAQVRYYKWMYYEMHKSMINDIEYDHLEKQLDVLAYQLGMPAIGIGCQDIFQDGLDESPSVLSRQIDFTIPYQGKETADAD